VATVKRPVFNPILAGIESELQRHLESNEDRLPYKFLLNFDNAEFTALINCGLADSQGVRLTTARTRVYLKLCEHLVIIRNRDKDPHNWKDYDPKH